MAERGAIKSFMQACGRGIIRVLRWIIKIMPYPIYKVFRSLFIWIGYPLLRSKRKLALKNLDMAYGDKKTREEKKDIIGKCFKMFGRGMIDLIYYSDRPEEVKENIEIEGLEHIEQANKDGKGVILVGAHFGYFILMYWRMVLEGFSTNVIMKRVRDPKFEEYISGFRKQQGINSIYDLPAKKCVVSCIRALRNKELLIILLDQNYGGDGRVFVDFFGTSAATATGPVVFAQRTEAPICPIFINQTGENTHKITIHPPLELEKNEDSAQMTQANIARITKILEQQINSHPEHWGGWMHKRWKTRTQEEQAAIDQGLGSASKAGSDLDYNNI